MCDPISVPFVIAAVILGVIALIVLVIGIVDVYHSDGGYHL